MARVLVTGSADGPGQMAARLMVADRQRSATSHFPPENPQGFSGARISPPLCSALWMFTYSLPAL
jgi:hypothetical protein